MTMTRHDSTEQASSPAAPWLPEGFLERVGAALVAPRRALAAADATADAAGKTGGDVAVLAALAYVSTRLSELIVALWVLVAEDILVGVRGIVASLSQALAMELALLFVASVVLTVAAGGRRHAGRDFDLACVAFVPLLTTKLTATLFLQIASVSPTPMMRDGISVIAYGWALVILLFAWQQARSRQGVGS